MLIQEGFPGGPSGKEPACQCRRHKRCGLNPWVGKSSWRRARQPTPVFLPGECRGQRSLAGYGPQGRKESDRTEETQHACTIPNSQSFPPPPLQPPWQPQVCSLCLQACFCFVNFHLYHFLRCHILMISYSIRLSLTYFVFIGMSLTAREKNMSHVFPHFSFPWTVSLYLSCLYWKPRVIVS